MASHHTESPPERLSGGVLLFLISVLVLAVFAVVSEGAQFATAREQEMAARGNLLMLVRHWDSTSGSLIGWLPVHQAAIHLELLDKLPAPHFDLNQAVNVVWLVRPGPNSAEGDVLVSPSPRTFEGERWLPVERDANLVRVGKRLFLLRRIMFGDSKWRLPARISAATRASRGGR